MFIGRVLLESSSDVEVDLGQPSKKIYKKKIHLLDGSHQRSFPRFILTDCFLLAVLRNVLLQTSHFKSHAAAF